MNPLIGYLIYAENRSARGIVRYTLGLLSALERAGLKFIVLHAGLERNKNGTVVLPGAGLLPGLLTWGQAEIAWAVHRHGLDLVHDPTGSLPLFLTGTKRVATIHDAIPYISPESSTALDWLIYHAWLPLAVRRLNALITVSQQSKIDILHYLPVNPENVTVIPIAANRTYRPLGREQLQAVLARYAIDFPYLLYVGSLEPRKNLPRLLEAYVLLRAWSPRWHLVIVGARNFWKSSPVGETVEKLDIKPWVHIIGYIPEEDLPALYNGADLFVFPSLYEGFGLPVLEAMACGTPVVCSHAGSLPEVAGDAARHRAP